MMEVIHSSKKMTTFITTAVRTSNPTWDNCEDYSLLGCDALWFGR
jgi:hypothetical protein